MAENKFLRQQLDESHRANVCLTNDLQKLTADWEHLRDEMSTKEDDWKQEERVNEQYFLYETRDLESPSDFLGLQRLLQSRAKSLVEIVA